MAPVAKLIPMKGIATALLLLVLARRDGLGADIESGQKSLLELQGAIETVLKESRTPGAAIAIVSRDKVEWMAGLGKADVAANKPVTTENLFRIGSVSRSEERRGGE